MLALLLDHAGSILEFLGVIPALIEIIRRQRKLQKQVVEVHLMMNSRLDDLLAKASKVGRFEGAETERLEAAMRATRKIP